MDTSKQTFQHIAIFNAGFTTNIHPFLKNRLTIKDNHLNLINTGRPQLSHVELQESFISFIKKKKKLMNYIVNYIIICM